MSYVTTRFDVPHIFRYGMTDEDEGHTWQLFYRCATVFTVDIKRDDIAGTPFEREWNKYCVEVDRHAWRTRWQEFCDFVIDYILPTLQKLAPVNGRHWTTFQDYLETPMYRLQLFKDDSAGDAVAELMHGPERRRSTLPYSLHIQPLSKLDIPIDLPRIHATEITILDHAKDWRQEPKKVQIIQTGEIANMIPAGGESQAVETGIVTNSSLEAMAKMLKLHQVKEYLNIPKPLALVTTNIPYDSEVKVAGLLYFGIPEDAKRLLDMSTEDLKDAHSRGLTDFWKAQIENILKVLASYNISHDSVHQFNIWIDAGTSAWLDSPRGVREEPFKESDFERLDAVFDVWLKGKINS